MTTIDQLTTREQQILSLVAKGYENKEIASRLSISVTTVQNHLQNIYTKLSIPNRTVAARLYWQHVAESNVQIGPRENS